jgi:hypothetical protein
MMTYLTLFTAISLGVRGAEDLATSPAPVRGLPRSTRMGWLLHRYAVNSVRTERVN